MAEFNVTKKEVGSVSILYANGYLDAHTAPELEKAFEDLIEENKYKIIVNLQGLNYISSAGLGVFMAYVENLRNNDGDIKFSNLKPEVFNIFDLLGFPMLYEFYDDESQAIEKFNVSS